MASSSIPSRISSKPRRKNRRGLAGSVANFGSTAGMLLAAGVAAAVTTIADSATLTDWAWRTPFLLGGVVASAAYILRRHLPETEYGPTEKTVTKTEAPLRRAIREQPRIMLAALLFTSGYGIVDYLTMVLLPTYAHEFGGIAEHLALRINTVGQALALLVVPLSGWLSDRAWTRRAALLAAFAAEAVFSWEAFRIVGSQGAAGLWLSQLLFAFLLALVMGVGPAMLAEQFPAGYRVSAHAVSFNIGIGIAGGTAPMIATALIEVTGSAMAAAAYLIFAAILALIGVLMLRDRTREEMNAADDQPAS